MAQFDEVVSRPGDGAGLAGPGAVLAEVGHARAVGLCVFDHGVHRRPLVEPREDEGLLLGPVPVKVHHILLLDVDEAVEDAEPSVRLKHIPPEVGDRVVLVLACSITGMALVPTVEGQEVGVFAVQLGRHPDVRVGHGEVDHRTPLERQQGLLALGDRVVGLPVVPVLLHGIFDRLSEVGLDFRGPHGDPVDEEHQVNRVFVGRVILQLRHHSQPVGLIAVQDALVPHIFGGSLAHVEVTGTGHLEAATEHLDRPILLQGFLQAVG